MNDVIKFPLSTEKNIKLMEAENKLIFIVDISARKNEIKAALEKMFNVKIVNVNTLIDPKGRKKAYVTFSDENPAIDIATNLGLM